MTKFVRNYSLVDQLIINLDQTIRSLNNRADNTNRPLPQSALASPPLLSPDEKHLSAQFMRINHAGEIAAQALYYGQACVAKTENTRALLWHAAKEEGDHLIWCQIRLKELESHTSYLNPLWYTGSFMIGVIAGLLNDQHSLGFLAETERQVEQHLSEHLEKLPANDYASKAILEQMCQDENQHAQVAIEQGGIELPFFVTILMKISSKVMTSLSKYF